MPDELVALSLEGHAQRHRLDSGFEGRVEAAVGVEPAHLTRVAEGGVHHTDTVPLGVVDPPRDRNGVDLWCHFVTTVIVPLRIRSTQSVM